MTTWDEFAVGAPEVSGVFRRRHRATGRLCLLGTVRRDGFPRISPIEPAIFEGELVIVGMPGTRKFRDLVREPRFCLHTATIDTNALEGDAKIFGKALETQDSGLRERYARHLLVETGMEVSAETFDHFFVADITSASSVAVVGETVRITVWKPGEGETVVEKT